MKTILIIACLSISSVALSGENEERVKTHHMVAALFAEKDFAGLEELAETYRSEKTRTPSGIWQLMEFYDGLANVGLNFPKEDQEGWAQAASAIDSWIEAYPDSPTPYVAKGTALMNRGWTYRGEGWVSKVKDTDIDRFREQAMFAARFLLENVEVGSQDPHWYYLIGDSLRSIGTPKETYLELMSEGLDRYPDYDPIYFKLSGYLSPKWYGSLPELEAFARESVERTQATRGYELYARIYWATGMYNSKQFAFQGPDASWQDMVTGMDDVIRRYPDQWNINRFAYFACYYRDRDATKKYLLMVEEPVPAKAWGGQEMNYQTCRLMARLEPSPNFPIPAKQRSK